MNTDTPVAFDKIIGECRNIFLKKTKDYGTSWRVLRTISVVDQIFIKALRIRNIQEKKEQKIADDIQSEYKGIINYAIIGLIQLELKPAIEDVPLDLLQNWYDGKVDQIKDLMLKKNHDYGEAWRDMSQESFTDLILVKLMRIKQILQNDGKTLISEGIDANYHDIVNYAVFALILLDK